MKFSEFAHMLFPIISAGSSTSSFAKTLFDTIVEERGQEIIAALSDSTFKAYYNGNNDISKTARKITPYLEPMDFEEYINNFPDSTAQLLCDSFEPYILGINLHNASTKITDLFTSIIKESASTNKKSTPKSANAVNVISENLASDRTEQLKEDIADDKEPSGACENESQESTNIQIINNPTTVNQYGRKNICIDHVEILNL